MCVFVSVCLFGCAIFVCARECLYVFGSVYLIVCVCFWVCVFCFFVCVFVCGCVLSLCTCSCLRVIVGMFVFCVGL